MIENIFSFAKAFDSAKNLQFVILTKEESLCDNFRFFTPLRFVLNDKLYV
ncbi:hypothetical protein [Chryseobacterium sp. G0201]|nr:hypothetical protein [Chryseobacterium sp. G0201]